MSNENYDLNSIVKDLNGGKLQEVVDPVKISALNKMFECPERCDFNALAKIMDWDFEPELDVAKEITCSLETGEILVETDHLNKKVAINSNNFIDHSLKTDTSDISEKVESLVDRKGYRRTYKN